MEISSLIPLLKQLQFSGNQSGNLSNCVHTQELLIKNEIRKIKPSFYKIRFFYYSSYKELEINIFSQKNYSKLLFFKEQLIDTNQYTISTSSCIFTLTKVKA